MFIFVVSAYVLVAAMAGCGLINAYGVIVNSEQDMGVYAFFTQMGAALLPLLGAVLLMGVLQMAQLLESILFHLENGKDEAEPQVQAPRKKKRKQEEETPFFGEAVLREQNGQRSMTKPVPSAPPSAASPVEQASTELTPEPPAREESQEDDSMSFFRMN